MNPRLLTPLVSAGAAWAARKSMNTIYAKRHHGQVPTRDDIQVPFRQVLIWTLSTAIVAALVDVAIQQAIARWAESSEGHELTAS